MESLFVCRLCGNQLPISPDVSFPSISVLNILLSEDRISNPVWREQVDLYTCQQCSLVQQAKVISPDKIYVDCANYTGEWRFQPHLESQLDLLDNISGEKSCIEVGCNSGSFLVELQRRGFGRVCGVEANRQAVETAQKRGVKVYNSLLTRDVCRSIVAEQGKFSLFIARHTLEHIADLTHFFDCIDILLEDNGQIFIEVPDFEPLHTPLPWSLTDIHHEHCTYFTKESLTNCLRKFSYTVNFLEKNALGGGVLNCLASKGARGEGERLNTRHTQLNAKEIERYVNCVREDVLTAKHDGVHVLLYGAGNHGISFLNISRLQDYITLILDDVPAKHGLYVPGCAAKIVPPSYLASLQGDCLVLLAIHPEYEEAAVNKIRRFSSGTTTIIFLLSKRSSLRLEK